MRNEICVCGCGSSELCVCGAKNWLIVVFSLKKLAKPSAVNKVVGGFRGGQRWEFHILKSLRVFEVLLILLWKYKDFESWTSTEKDKTHTQVRWVFLICTIFSLLPWLWSSVHEEHQITSYIMLTMTKCQYKNNWLREELFDRTVWYLTTMHQTVNSLLVSVEFQNAKNKTTTQKHPFWLAHLRHIAQNLTFNNQFFWLHTELKKA